MNLTIQILRLNKNFITLKIDDIEKFELLFFSKKDNPVNPYIDNYRSFELDYKN